MTFKNVETFLTNFLDIFQRSARFDLNLDELKGNFVTRKQCGGGGGGEGGPTQIDEILERGNIFENLCNVESHEEPRRGATGMSPDELSSCLPATPIFSYRVTATLSIRYDSSDQTEKRPRQRMTSRNRSLLPGRKKICPKAKKRHSEAYGFTRESCARRPFHRRAINYY